MLVAARRGGGLPLWSELPSVASAALFRQLTFSPVCDMLLLVGRGWSAWAMCEPQSSKWVLWYAASAGGG